MSDFSFLDTIEEMTHIAVRGARMHNLKNISLDIPRDQLVVITGVSGSGKSSLAFDTLYAEGQRRYVESLSPYARQFLGMMDKPDVDAVEGLSPAISIEQKTVGHNPRSTVGTVTEIYDYLRLLFAKIGIQHCVDHPHIPVQGQTTEAIVDAIMTDFADQKIQIAAPVVRGRKGHYRDLFEGFAQQGFTTVVADNEFMQLAPELQLNRYKVHNISLVVDRLKITPDDKQRLQAAVDLALLKGDDSVEVYSQNPEGTWEPRLFNRSNTCPECQRSYEALAPNSFSFNSPFGACETCNGLGEIRDFVPELMVEDPSLSINDGALLPIGKKRDTIFWKLLITAAEHFNIPLNKPYSSLDAKQLKTLYLGGQRKYFTVRRTASSWQTEERFDGIIGELRRAYKSSASSNVLASLERFMKSVACPDCNGGRLKPDRLAVTIQGKNIAEIVNLTVDDVREFFRQLPLSPREAKIATLILREIISRSEFLMEVGLQYLTLNRAARTLSGGEGQRIRLAAQIGSQLVGVMYVLDEPSIGLHQHDNKRLITSLKKLRDLGNSVIVVEHDREMIEEADYLVDLGPGAGVKGGELMFSDVPSELDTPKERVSLTMEYLSGAKTIRVPKVRRPGNGKTMTLKGATGHNLQNVDVTLPLGCFICVTGMSGSGKSSLINKTLVPIIGRHFRQDAVAVPLDYTALEGLEHLDKFIEIDQKPIGRTPRSNPATYTGLFTAIRDLFTQLPESKIRGYKAGRFSFNVTGGRCEECEGAGLRKIEMNFLPDVYVQCDTCNGKRYNDETLQVVYKEKSISDVLEMTVEEATEFFKDIPSIFRKVSTLNEVGLGYIKLGQQATTLSGGEAQRVKLATELSKIGTGKTLYVLDEPTTGLHFEDIAILLTMLNRLVDKGNTVLVIEHNLDVVKVADWIIDLGPEGGKNGGRIVAEGTPEIIAEHPESLTGRYLKKEMNL